VLMTVMNLLIMTVPLYRCTLGSRAPDYRRLESGSDRAGNGSRAPDYRRLESGSDRAGNQWYTWNSNFPRPGLSQLESGSDRAGKFV
jgi:hypothetical protein